MKLISVCIILLAALTVQAHVETGPYEGKTATGETCRMVAGPMFFDGNLHHPLTERVTVTVDGVQFTLGHPPVVDAANAVAFFNHDVFQGVLPTATGAKALVIHMDHSPAHDGPVGFTLIENFWKSGQKQSLNCGNLVFTGGR